MTKVNHKDNFFYAFSYPKAYGSPEVYIVNVIKGLGYIPILGVAPQLSLAIASALPCSNNADDWALVGALLGRAAISLACPFALPVIDTIASVWRAVELSKQG